jgi:trimeric autotransporter adhesin
VNFTYEITKKSFLFSITTFMKKYYVLLCLFFFTSLLAQVGINTTTPNAQLHIQSSNQAAPSNTDGMLIPKVDVFPATNPTAAQQGMLVYLTTTVGSNPPGFYYWDNTSITWKPVGNEQDRDFLKVGTSEASTNILDNKYTFGNNGFGTTTPARRLHVANGVSGATSSASTGILLESNANVYQHFLTPSTAENGLLFGTDTNPIGSGIIYNNVSNTDGFQFRTGGNFTRMTLTNTGNLGVGTISPARRLHVANGTSGATSNANAGVVVESNGNVFQHFLTPSTAENGLLFGTDTNSIGSGLIFNNTSTLNGLQFRTGGNATRMTLTNTGNLGIGSITPQERLHVIGNIRMVDGNEAAGRVLTSDVNGTATWQNASANAWGLTGNTGTDPLTNFIGTTDNVDLVFKRSNTISGKITSLNTSFGLNSLLAPTVSGSQNTAFGVSSMRNTSDGVQNAAFGYNSLINNTFGFGNTAVGVFSLGQNITGGRNTGIGRASLGSNTSGIHNTGLGFQTDVLANNLNNATAIGAYAAVGANNSIVLGSIAGINFATSNVNVGIGTTTPLERFHVVGNIRMVDGNEAVGKVLTSDANGTATWQNASANAWGVLGNSGTNADTNFLGTSDNTDLVLRTNNNDNLRIKNDGRIEIGNKGTNPTYLGSSSLLKKFFVASEGTDNNIVFQTSNNTNDPVSTFYGISRGTTLAPTLVNSGQFISFNYFTGYDGVQYIPAAAISARIDGTAALNKMPGSLHFSTTPIGGTSPNERMTIKSSGNIGIGTTSPLEILHVVGRIRMVDGNQAAGKVLTSDINGTATWQNASNNAWGLTGNAGTSATTNFMGTSDDVDVIFKRNDIRSGLFGTTNSSFGLNALNIASTGSNNTAIGVEALKINTTGSNNTAIGQNALATINQGSNNTGIGVDTATTSTLLTNATAIGYKATVGSSNSLVLGSINGTNGATSSVNVGIGITAPQATLEVVDSNAVTSATVEGIVNVMTNGPQTIDSGGSITLGGTFTDAGNTFRTFGSIEGRKANATTNSSSGYLILKTNNGGTLTERMRITNAGDVGIGTPTPGGQFELSLNEGRKPTSNTWTIPSDARLKNVKGVYEKGLVEILQLKPIRYNYKNTDKKTFEQKVLDKEAYGFLAQEVQPLFPEAVGTDADGYLNFDIHPILIASVNAFKELNTKYEELKSENNDLNEKLIALLARIELLEKK